MASLPPGALDLAAAMIRTFEGFRSAPYWDAAGGVFSIGFGFCTLADGSTVTAHTAPLTADQCDVLLEAKLTREYGPGVLTACAGAVLSDAQLAALVSWAFNLGLGWIAKSGLPPVLRRRDWEMAANIMRRFNQAGGHVLDGLVRRRAAESAVFLGASWPTPGYGGPTAPAVQQQPHARPGVGVTQRPLSPGMMRPPVAVQSSQQSAADGQPGADALMAKYD